MIQAEPLYIVVTGEKQNRRAHFASKFQNHAQAFASAFAHDPLRPRVDEYQMITLGADFQPGVSKPFKVRMPREGAAVQVDESPSIVDFGYMNESTDDSPDVVFRIWALTRTEAEAKAAEMRDEKLRYGQWPPMKERWRVRIPADLPKKPTGDFDVAIYGSKDPFLRMALSAHYGIEVDGFMAGSDTPGVMSIADLLNGLQSDGRALFAHGPGHVIPIVTISSSSPPPDPPVPAGFGVAFYIEKETERA
jgi:hypothetical protein